MRMLILSALIWGFGLTAQAQAPKATLADAALLIGLWEGEGFGGKVQEGWSAPLAGRMVGHFSAASASGKPMFHQSLIIEEHEGSLRMRLKHFSPDFKGWEAQDKTVDFALVSAALGAVTFGPAAFTREGDVLTLRLQLSEKGVKREEVMRYRRVK
ncbi:MAG: hypothetical protein IT546_15195 [Caulobacteraceae bacterium]|nr:hypothetical protein [Caulobacteraceae bacterium]